METVLHLLVRVSARETERKRISAAWTKRFAPDFNIVAMFAPGENALSRLFRWLLDENGNHGQGGVFRDLFVTDILLDDPDRWRGATASCEVATADGKGRIDLLIVSEDGARCVVIENKPWAGWQPDQLVRYFADQCRQRDEVRVHALIGHANPSKSIAQHVGEQAVADMPSSVQGSGFDEVVRWLEGCASVAQADKVRGFLLDLADYCRHSILREPTMTEVNDTADLIVNGGGPALRAAYAIAAALPLAMSRDVAQRLGATCEIVADQPIIRFTIDSVDLRFVLFGNINAWVGVTDNVDVPRLQGAVAWGAPEVRWPRWVHIKKVGVEGRMLNEAIVKGDVEAVARLVPAVARTVIGSSENL